MNIKFFKVALGLAFAAIAFNASAQKTYTQGIAIYGLTTAAGDVDSKIYFTADSSAAVTVQGPATIKLLSNSKGTYFAVVIDVPVASIKKAAILTPDEIDQFAAAAPKFTFTAGTETKQINGFNCKKVTVKDSKSGSTSTAWVTKDITAPVNSLTKAFADAGGFPVQFTTTQQGQSVDVTLKSISDTKPPVGTFGIAGFEKISLDDLKAMGGR
ncbi:DUF4412 domain-containing protein [Mucilaginibacter sp.]|uniref:DUF4412 domain-containing protein n=1 Tax=Mucilaginibacter sp. TaxID=1882438 RepID=UPI002602D897|nr:DUF4412 domain-containing protein [Mucilaginibacter sp.]MDB5031945.1 hypothetical protein [Mucilaginibacter sp.]